MNCLLNVSSAALFSRNRPFIVKTSLYGYCCSSWIRSIQHARVKAINVGFMSMRFPVQCYSTSHGGRASCSPKLDFASSMEEKDTFYIVRKGDLVGVYKSLSDCQAQVGSSVCDPPASVFKGCSFPREAEEYLVSRGLKNAAYSISASDVKEDLFGKLIPCPFQQPSSPEAKKSKKESPRKISQEVLESDGNVVSWSQVIDGLDPERNLIELETSAAAQTVYSKCSCILEFDGASKGNPGQAGAGAVLRAEDGRVVYRLREGLGITTNNVAEYRAMILGMKYALKKGFKQIHVQGDSKLICMQGLNSEADAQANLAINLGDGEVQEDCIKK
ncbi:uncharacterized protein LOC122069224 isoform X2 [Macadamia integrifolia]|uniref:uncharacterized protein LOC122069224 isoform X2 n=1 Tax=Macadamia integrifolia TaxID=60698 RepID=UPI001C4F705F|nr:uncharacterized protein LOC122069224 isoform X2 [Macadamia integrifolia]